MLTPLVVNRPDNKSQRLHIQNFVEMHTCADWSDVSYKEIRQQTLKYHRFNRLQLDCSRSGHWRGIVQVKLVQWVMLLQTRMPVYVRNYLSTKACGTWRISIM